MTIIIALKVAAGVVLAADSRLTVYENGQVVFLSDNNFKLFGVKGRPVGILTCGSSFLEERAVGSWLEDFTNRVAPELQDIDAILDALTEKLPPPQQGSVSYLLAGFEPTATRGADAQIWKINRFSTGATNRFDLSSSAIFWDGEFEALTRLLLGFAPTYASLVAATPIKDGEVRVPYYAFSLQEGVDYVEFLATSQVQFQRFVSEPQTCGGPIDIAVITPEAGFQWVRRKDLPPYTYLS